jgi:hypothetical protein
VSYHLSLSDIKMVRFTKEEIERFSERLENGLENSDCRSIFREFLRSHKKDNLLLAFQLWTLANENSTLTDEMRNLMDNVDGFQRGNLDEMEPHGQIEDVKRKCYKRFATCREEFMAYLRKHHQN